MVDWTRGIAQGAGAALGYITGGPEGVISGAGLAGQLVDRKRDFDTMRRGSYPPPTPVSLVRSRSAGSLSTRSRMSLTSTPASTRRFSDFVGGSTSSVATPGSNPASSIVDSNRQIGIVKPIRGKRKLSKKAKARKRKKLRFKKKVTKTLVSLGAVNVYKELTNSVLTLNAYSGPTSWDSTLLQTFTFTNVTEANEGGGFWYGGMNANGAARTQDMYQLLNLQNNELFMYQTTSGVNPVNSTVAGIGTTNIGAISVGANGMKVWISMVKYTIAVRNQMTTKPVCVDVYDMVAQKNFSPDSPYRTANLAYNKCIADETFSYNGTTTTNRLTLDDPQTKPGDIPNYSNYWKAKSATRLFLQPGETKMITFYGKKGWYDGKKANALYALSGKTTEFLFIVGAGQCPGLVNTDAFPQITWTKDIRYRHQQGFGKPKNLIISNTQTI